MDNVKWLLCLVLVLAAVEIIECKGRIKFGKHKNRGRGGWFFGWGKSKSSSHYYSSSSRYSGHGTGGSHSYPVSQGYSGSGSRTLGASRRMPSIPTYYTSPQHVYVTQYRNSESRYGDLLTGLTMYNLGRSHAHHHHHYYSDDYYRTAAHHRDIDSPAANTVHVKPKEEAVCFLKIKEDKEEDVLKIPCAIVSTFGNGTVETLDNARNKTAHNCSGALKTTFGNQSAVNETNISNNTNVNKTSSNITVNCNNSKDNFTNPLAVKGVPVDVKDKQCSVEIKTQVKGQDKVKVIRTNVDCLVLQRYAEMSIPENRTSAFLPSRYELKAMLNRLPWWLALIIAV
ncbi:uncharacterized protein [Choristoneura fumiferana]|uniref:uncharacterized protein n=1 Tax=Choristoneura fumiferana TaxID=7141 RepID=UPI003D1575E8